MRINRNSRRNAYRNAMRTNASRRRLNSSKDTDALIKEAVSLQPEYNNGSYIRKNMSEDLYYFCVNLIDRAYKTIDTYGYWVRPAFMDDFGKPTEIHESETNRVLTNISLEDELEYVVSLLADGYTPDTVVTELIDWYLDKANSDTASRTSVRTNSNRRRLNCATAADYDREALIERYDDEDMADKIIEAAIALGYSNNKCITTDWDVYYVNTDAEFGETWLEMAYDLSQLPANFDFLLDYFDYEAFGKAFLSGAYYYKGDGFYVIDVDRS